MYFIYDDPSIDHALDRLHKLIKLSDHSPTIVLGHSFGGALALEYAHRYPSKRLSGLALVSWIYDMDWARLFSTAYPSDSALADAAWEQDDIDADAKLKSSMLLLKKYYFPTSMLQAGTKYLDNLTYDADTYLRCSTDYFPHINLMPRLETLRVPILSVCGELDKIVPPDYLNRVTTVNPMIKLHELPEAGHFPFIDRPAAFGLLISNFIRKLIS
jgi:pimeloyl-ACP methyl ester carboxylesterase